MAVFSFSVKPNHLDGELLVMKVKKHCEKQGIDFSKVVLDSLKLYERQVIDGK